MASLFPPPAWLKVCTTCDRYAPVQGGIGDRLADALEAASTDMVAGGRLAFRRVPCLSGCKQPGNIALGASAKVKMRINRVTAQDADDLIRLAELFAASPKGDVPEEDWPPALKGHLATYVKPRPTGG
ncbi:DUF1636 family protein [Sphingobium sp. SA2]|uniref:DUF1636 family protein n=1 Tax=Sphingobium sp. SA2 TaxID=1524832 RepID=UPI0028C1B3FD|nr:DUF1636 family protein [Sphingobium sp. SA2]MDT7532026.1 DUF1636 family protein [Sphingobium sp. SA2]